ncbi:GNAT family N-acetyltransferase [Pseudomonas protegens]|jgi:GNAT superfamily N-acetyltransferase|uniref:Acetyltransferase, GNAT family n=2 Tax=Pseudomonas protegens TaxID=380021 RepID=Q4KDD3_PSEF5|nr:MULTISPECIES: GNAT family N-acetyltransferase [Pseudomonas]BCQ61633.1 acetyltransferase [Pseudomonas sp. Boi14]AAY91916.1 acetyltransferase, GNAT family [Pseudomonas protegens Pf-5]APC21118.1 GNAT family N-acetyltransferase [Pseudomonas protegens]ASE23848.1 N-acetyltransferase [Pseudomonas protegens]MBF0641948.1 GNAT family N-acetyltransferase [Pseudomonas protegens]
MPSTALDTLAHPPFPAQQGQYWIDALNDGSHVLIRPLRPQDREREKAFIENLSPATRHQRFLGEIKEVGEQLLNQLMDVGTPQRVAYVALVHDNGELREVGISRYAQVDEQPSHCEFAVTIADEWQGKGLGALLMQHLIDEARNNGFQQMYSVDSAANYSMRRLAKQLGMRSAIDPDDATQVIHSLAL